jgi:hypothetical protein
MKAILKVQIDLGNSAFEDNESECTRIVNDSMAMQHYQEAADRAREGFPESRSYDLRDVNGNVCGQYTISLVEG